MDKIILNKDQVYELVQTNRYKVNDNSKFFSRCIDGRYEDKLKVKNEKLTSEQEIDLPPLAIAGADAGELALLFVCANSYGFEIDYEKAYQSLVDVVGGEKNLNFHTDHHAKHGLIIGGCGHIKQMTLDPKAYNITTNQIQTIKQHLTKAKQQGAKETILEGDHIERAVLLVTGNWSVKTRYLSGDALLEVFVHHQSLIDQRHRAIIKKLIENNAVKLLDGQDEEYLYEALSSQTEDHLMETAKKLAKGLPIFLVSFSPDGSFKLKEMEKV